MVGQQLRFKPKEQQSFIAIFRVEARTTISLLLKSIDGWVCCRYRGR
jgi:hypothetical protein